MELIDLGQVAANMESGREPTAKLRITRGDHWSAARALLQHLRGGAGNPPVIKDEGKFWRYDGGLWSELSMDDIKRTLLRISTWATWSDDSPIRVTRGLVNSIAELAELEAASEGFFGRRPPSGVAFANGYAQVSAKGVELLDLKPEHMVRHMHRDDYRPDAQCPTWLRFLDDVWDDCTPTDRAQRKTFLSQFIGACLTGAAPTHNRAVMLLGSGANGKSVLCDVIADLFPPDAVAAVPPQEMESDYKVASLVGAQLNLVSDLPARDFRDTGGFKQIVAGDLVGARLPYGQPFRFRPAAGHLFSANRLPLHNDGSHGFFRRWVVLTFTRRFDPSEAVPRDELVGSLLAERAGIMRWALEGACSLMARRSFFVPETSQREIDEWRNSADQVALFLEERCHVHGKGELRIYKKPCAECPGTTPDALYRHYCEWAGDNGVGKMAKRELLRRLMDHHDVTKAKRLDGTQYGVYIRKPFRKGWEETLKKGTGA